MKTKHLVLALVIGLTNAIGLHVLECHAEPSFAVSNVSIRQRWPWDKRVDINFLLKMPQGANPEQTVDIQVSGKDGVAPVMLSHESLSGDLFSVAPGYRCIVWDPTIDHAGKTFTQFNVEFSVSPSKPTYLIVDLAKSPQDDGHITFKYDAIWADTTSTVYKTSKIVFRRIPATTSLVWQAISNGRDYFTFGSPNSETERTVTRERQVNIKLDQDFWMAIFELTQEQLWHVTDRFGHANPSFPVQLSYNDMRGSISDGINWPDTGYTVATASVLAAFRSHTGLNVDLPTEAQWEYACRAGTTTPFNDGAFLESYTTNDYNDSLMLLGRFALNGKILTHVGQYAPNTWGLYDMHGNSYEYCLDWARDNINPDGLELLVNPVGPDPSPTFTTRIVRSGSQGSPAKDCRSASRTLVSPTTGYIGYRLVIPAID